MAEPGNALNRRAMLALAALTAGAPCPVFAAPADPVETLLLWPRGAPGGNTRTRMLKPEVPERSIDPAFHDRYAMHTTEPLITIMRAAKPNGAALLLIPGGGYRWAVVDKEGFDCARVFAKAGVTCFVLRYRLPGDGWDAGPDATLQDAQRAMRLIRANAKTFGINPEWLAVLGASAGGHLAGMLAARSDERVYAPVDDADNQSARPRVAVLLYPVATMADPLAHKGSRDELLGTNPSAQQIAANSVENRVGADFPPVFLLHALDDPSVPPENTLNLLSALRAQKIAAECHLFQEGGHGFGIRLAEGKPCAAWPDLVLAWGRRNAWLT
jgi:acetyl esterase/lipase